MSAPTCILCDRLLLVDRRRAIFCGDCTSDAIRVRGWANRRGVSYEEAAQHFRRACPECGTSMLREPPHMVRCSGCTGSRATSTSLPDPQSVPEDWPRCQDCGEAVHDKRATFCRPCRQVSKAIYAWANKTGYTYAEARAQFHRPCPICRTSMISERPAAKACRACTATPHGRRVLSIAHRYSISVEESLSLMAVLDCQVCGMHLPTTFGKHRHIDHDHATGRVRGVLCHWCNMMLGSARDRAEVLRQGADYLDQRA